ncbi:hypothetical protein E2C01_029104 [Portunus trituberculatus]|uniref:Uncharacterized protein n=1 Tax=Portunus trituberculatus TaxID=210409 RepID=A0A5B7EQL5_PORTR|nr:hypothetical protein [Portunus trituberculatus]
MSRGPLGGSGAAARQVLLIFPSRTRCSISTSSPPSFFHQLSFYREYYPEMRTAAHIPASALRTSSHGRAGGRAERRGKCGWVGKCSSELKKGNRALGAPLLCSSPPL